MSNDIQRELVTWLHYFLIMLIAATVAGFFYEQSMRVPADADVGSGAGISINFHGLIQSLWRDYYRWWLGVFMGLSAVRFLFLFLNRMRVKSALR
jgi:hypothetical protein